MSGHGITGRLSSRITVGGGRLAAAPETSCRTIEICGRPIGRGLINISTVRRIAKLRNEGMAEGRLHVALAMGGNGGIRILRVTRLKIVNRIKEPTGTVENLARRIRLVIVLQHVKCTDRQGYQHVIDDNGCENAR